VGVGAVWTLDQVDGPASTLDPLGVLALVAGATERVALGLAVLAVPSRAPLTLAKALSTLDHLSGGRLIVGAGFGDLTIFPAHGLGDRAWPIPGLGDQRSLGTLLDQQLDLLIELWSGQPVTANVGPFRLRDVQASPPPVQQPHPPIWLGGRSRPALERTVRRADGWLAPGKATTAEVAGDIVKLRDMLAAAGRDPAKMPIAKRLYLHIEDRPGADVDRVRDWLTTFYGTSTVADTAAVVGSPARAVEAVSEILDAGADHVIVHPMVDVDRQHDLVAAHVLPALR
jgi:alkanesulfonate monooxygenase SsuD/methylene tetrahydromethanopterin reductase-like flavin-dependent oxidoreductase (luciferase family)